MHRTCCARFVLLLTLHAFSVAAFALDQIGIALKDLHGADWQAQDMQLKLDLPLGAAMSGDLLIASLHLPAPVGAIEAVRMRCASLSYDETGLACSGQLQIAQLLGAKIVAPAQLRHAAASGRLELELRDVALGGGRWHIAFTRQDGSYTVNLQAPRLDAAAAVALLKRFAPDFDHTISGELGLRAELRGAADGIDSVTLTLSADAVDFANGSGSQAGEKLQLTLSAAARRHGADWQGDARLDVAAGNLFVDPLYLEITPASELQLQSRLQWTAVAQRLRLSGLQLDHAQVARAQADMQLRIGETTSLEALDLNIADAQLPGAYLSYIQPWLHGHIGDALETAGQFSGRYILQAEGDSAVQLQLQAVDIVDTGGRFSFDNLSGDIDWGSDAVARTSRLRWNRGSVFRLALGAADIAVLSRGTQFELREAVQIPVLDGSLALNDLALSEPGTEAMRFRFDGALSPVSMQAVCAALDWPPFGGQLAGRIPAAQYADGVLEVGGELQVRAFDGELAVRQLRLEQPFGRVPRLYADLSIDNLDLDALTRTFEFGKIEGRISGYAKDLYLEAWQPVSFAARLATPEGDRSRHRISQKAVDNLSSIGGGVGGALSRTFMGMFEEFPYDKLGLSCTLENGVCQMGGVEPLENGYYIVKSTLLPPRIDVVGYADRVDWHTLIDRLKSVTLDQAPVVR